MPSVTQSAVATLSAAGTFSTTVAPPTAVPLSISASGSISIPTSSAGGYIEATVFDSVSGAPCCGIADTITPEQATAGSKAFNIGVAGPGFANPASLQISIATRGSDDGSVPAPEVSGASQPAQLFASGDPNGRFCVIDNGFPGNGGVDGGAGYDTCLNGAIAQGENVYPNGNIPDYMATAETITTSALETNISLRYKNPA